MGKHNKDNAGVIAPPPLLFGIVMGIGLLLHYWIFPITIMPESRALSETIGNVFFIIYGLITLPSVIVMIRNKTALATHKPTTSIVTTGFFKFSRNPLYLSLLLLYTGIAFRINSLWVLLLLPVLFIMLDRGVVQREEGYLEGKFGDEYAQYKNSVRRWI